MKRWPQARAGEKMVAGYVHVETELSQSPKRAGSPCGDVFLCERTVAGTTLVCADGIGSGPHAHIAAQMCATRLLELLRLGFSLRRRGSSCRGDDGAMARHQQTLHGFLDRPNPW